MKRKAPDIQARLDLLFQDYARRLPGKVTEIEQAWRALQDAPDSDRHQVLVRLCHTLAGSGASYGYEQVTEQSRCIERQLLDANFAYPPEPAIADKIESALLRLKQLAGQAPDRRMQHPATNREDSK